MLTQAAFFLAFGAAVASMLSIAACQILMGAALICTLLAYKRLRLPHIWLPLAVFIGWTLLSLALSPDPRAGLPQLRKLYVFLMLPIAFTAIAQLFQLRQLVWWWAGAATASGVWSFVQFWTKRQRAISHHEDFYLSYVGDRVTGFMGHWMTFGAAQMVALVLLLALLMFAPPQRYRWIAAIAAVLITVSIVIGWTRSVWLATAISVLYLVIIWRPKLLVLLPILAVAGWFIAPRSIKMRVTSIYQPHGETDSNQHRYVTRRVGIEMIKAHPWFGLGPEMPGKHFDEYLPSDIHRPLPTGYYGHLHNVYLQYAAERGIPALLAFLWIIGLTLKDWWTGTRHNPNTLARGMLHGCVAAVLALLVEGFFEHNLGDSEVLSMFWAVVASGYRALEAQA